MINNGIYLLQTPNGIAARPSPSPSSSSLTRAPASAFVMPPKPLAITPKGTAAMISKPFGSAVNQ